MVTIALIAIIIAVLVFSVVQYLRYSKKTDQENRLISQSFIEISINNKLQRREVAAMQFELWWNNTGQDIVDQFILSKNFNDGVAAIVREAARICASEYVINQLSMKETQAVFQLNIQMTKRKGDKRRFERERDGLNDYVLSNGESLVALGYVDDVFRKIFEQ